MKQPPKKRAWLPWALGLGGYAIALIALTLIERADPDASITTFADAFWYSLVTMSTVGYGDLYPVTPWGKVLGMVFVLLSLGLLSFILSVLVQIITGKMLPALRLWPLRRHHWYIFSCRSSEATALREDLARQDPDGVFLFPGEPRDGDLTYPGSMEALAARKKNGCSLFYMDGALDKALQALSLGHPVYCLTDFAMDSCPQGLTLFNRYECCAQGYWRSHGMSPEEGSTVIVGDGEYAQHLLTRGLLINVLDTQGGRRYHLFGDWQGYLQNHHRLDQVFGLNEEKSGCDSLYFHQDSWNADPQLLAQADRVILCADNMAENLALLGKLRQFFPIQGRIHLLFDRDIPGVEVFGTDRDIYTAEAVCRLVQAQAGRTMHEIYCRSAGGSAPSWQELSEFLRQSNIAAADHLLTKLRLLLQDTGICQITAPLCAQAYEKYQALTPQEKESCRELEHIRWMVFHSLYNWRYAPKRSNAAREHHLMLPYRQLPPEEQAKDDYAWEMLRELSQYLPS